VSGVGVGDRKRGGKRERWIDGSAACWDTIRVNQAKGLGLSHLKYVISLALFMALQPPR